MEETRLVQVTPETDTVRIVLADDDRLFTQMMRARLSMRQEFEVVGIAENGREAVQLTAELGPDLVLMDVSMPVLDGIEASRLIRAAENPPAVVFVTGEEEAADGRAYGAGGAAYLRKTGDLVGLIDLILALAKIEVVTGGQARHA
jgi:DNA-binding NarL/FixJ family response regulator